MSSHGFDDAIRQFQEPARQPGAKVPTPVPGTAALSIHRIGEEAPEQEGRQAIDGKMLTSRGPAHTETGNVWNHTPQLEMEIGVFMEQAYVLNGGGSITVDPNIANIWNISLSANATIAFANPQPIPQDQIDAGRDRNRSTGIVLRVIRNGHDYTFSGVQAPEGTDARIQADANRDKWVADWWGGPELGSNWELQLVASGYAG